jgi:hypothetical protein
MLPSKYPQAIVAGESLATIIGITFRIITKAAVGSERVAALIFFSIAPCLIILGIICHFYVMGSKMVKFYTIDCFDIDGQLQLEDNVTSKAQKWRNTVASKHTPFFQARCTMRPVGS